MSNVDKIKDIFRQKPRFEPKYSGGFGLGEWENIILQYGYIINVNMEMSLDQHTKYEVDVIFPEYTINNDGTDTLTKLKTDLESVGVMLGSFNPRRERDIHNMWGMLRYTASPMRWEATLYLYDYSFSIGSVESPVNEEDVRRFIDEIRDQSVLTMADIEDVMVSMEREPWFPRNTTIMLHPSQVEALEADSRFSYERENKDELDIEENTNTDKLKKFFGKR